MAWAPPKPIVNEDLLRSGKVTVSHPQGSNQPPSIFIDKSVINTLASEWKYSVVIKLLGKILPFSQLERKIKDLWCRPTRVLELHNNYVLVRFNSEADFNYALHNSPWLITGHYLVVRKWDPGFDARTEQIRLIRAWVLIKGLRVIMHDKQVLFAIVSAIGKPIKVDDTKPPSGQFARVCVEIDISAPLKGEMLVNGQRMEVEYEGLDVCRNCGRYGHGLNQCRSSIQNKFYQPGLEQISIIS